MVKVAIADHSGGLGRVITEAIFATGKHQVFVLSRNPRRLFDDDIDIRSLEVDYSSTAQIANVLRSNHIQVVVSAIGIVFEDSHLAQMNLIDAASQSGTVTRFAPSEYAIDYVEAARNGFPFPVLGLAAYKSSHYKVEAFEKLKVTEMKHTRFIIGFLMDYYGFPAEPVPVLPLAVVLDMENCKAGIPGDGEGRITPTHSETIGKSVAASLDLPTWPSRSWIVGGTLTWNEALKIAEKARGTSPALYRGRN
ncbi:hypothetical protein QQX98_000406 [Neonectria punicea]|uniref:NAD(P)-binding domain-containing protein n=1 Tax=Neonectria punicea TaxID=979145 RepID=A0ABR1HUZ9_9HYPO